jgi:hypothetical protein
VANSSVEAPLTAAGRLREEMTAAPAVASPPLINDLLDI